jgi:hypothetical protein
MDSSCRTSKGSTLKLVKPQVQRSTIKAPPVRCGADDRQALEQLCRYITRPALANRRVQTN